MVQMIPATIAHWSRDKTPKAEVISPQAYAVGLEYLSGMRISTPCGVFRMLSDRGNAATGLYVLNRLK